MALLAALAFSPAIQAQSAPACSAELQQPRPVLAHTLAALAQHENVQMGGARIDARGGLVRAGFAEAERGHLPGARLPAWQRVWQYWRAVPDFYAQNLAWLDGEASTALKRSTLIDQPWSAAFISWLMRTAGLQRNRFAFSASHHDYVRAALAATDAEAMGRHTRYGWRACDLAQTPPGLGDLLCFTRGTAAHLDSFAQVREAVASGALPMHCELVVAQDDDQVQTMGGNVLDTVTLRQLDLQPGSGRLSPAYLQSTHRQQRRPLLAPPPPANAPLWTQTHLNQESWSVLLQMRSAAWRPPY